MYQVSIICQLIHRPTVTQPSKQPRNIGIRNPILWAWKPRPREFRQLPVCQCRFGRLWRFQDLACFKWQTTSPWGCVPHFVNPARTSSACLFCFIFVPLHFSVYCGGGSAELDGLPIAKHVSHHPTAELSSCGSLVLESPCCHLQTCKSPRPRFTWQLPHVLLPDFCSRKLISTSS